MGAALSFHATWMWQAAHFDSVNGVTQAHHEVQLQARLRHIYDRAHFHLNAKSHAVHMTKAVSVTGLHTSGYS
ncbi:hypothetical protein PI125_g22289 [Phytophthora idaei]|nr:hypothetical protein PI125_g22289 [Phytophthora idaei]